jgi:hypothetical protein
VKSSPKHVPFDSIYRPDFEVVEERQGKVSLFPHTEQLPLLLRALNLEFYGALPDKIARTDKRGDGFHKNLLKHSALSFCSGMNSARNDGVRLMALADADMVTRVTIVQQITEHTNQGSIHRFKFYGGPDFFPEIRLSGRRVLFADHVLQRFSSRVPNNVGENLSFLLLAFFGTPHIALPVGSGHAFIVDYLGSVLAFPFRMNDEVFVVVTCLTVNEMNSVKREAPPYAFNLHYGETFSVPRIRHWSPTKWMIDLLGKWERKAALPPPRPDIPKKMTWHWMADRIKEFEEKKGHGPGTKFFFLDHIPGPNCIEFLPGQPEPRVDERKIYNDLTPRPDWDAIFTKREDATWKIPEAEMPPDEAK